MRFAIIGDLHGCVSDLKRIKRKIMKCQALFITGDIAGTISYSLILKSLIKSGRISREKYIELVYGQYLHQFTEFQIKTAEKIFEILLEVNIPVFLTHGNSDTKGVREHLKLLADEKSNSIFYIGNSVVEYDNWVVVGYGFCSPANYRIPFQTPGEKKMDDIREDLSKLEIKIKDLETKDNHILFGLFHEPPKDSNLDYIPKQSAHCGSELIREHISKMHYNFVFAGHVHESQNYEYINNQLLLNPGALVEGKWAIIDIKTREVELHKSLRRLSFGNLIYKIRHIFK